MGSPLGGHLHAVLHHGAFRGHRCLLEPSGTAKHPDGAARDGELGT